MNIFKRYKVIAETELKTGIKVSQVLDKWRGVITIKTEILR